MNSRGAFLCPARCHRRQTASLSSRSRPDRATGRASPASSKIKTVWMAEIASRTSGTGVAKAVASPVSHICYGKPGCFEKNLAAPFQPNESSLRGLSPAVGPGADWTVKPLGGSSDDANRPARGVRTVWRLHPPWHRTIVIQRSMGAEVVITIQVRFKGLVKLPFVEHDHPINLGHVRFKTTHSCATFCLAYEIITSLAWRI